MAVAQEINLGHYSSRLESGDAALSNQPADDAGIGFCRRHILRLSVLAECSKLEARAIPGASAGRWQDPLYGYGNRPNVALVSEFNKQERLVPSAASH